MNMPEIGDRRRLSTPEIGVQTQNVIDDKDPAEGFELLKRAGFDCCDFSLNGYLKNTSLYRQKVNAFFDQPEQELERFFRPHKEAAEAAGIRIHQMHMPYPNYVPGAGSELNDYLKDVVAGKSMKICAFLGAAILWCTVLNWLIIWDPKRRNGRKPGDSLNTWRLWQRSWGLPSALKTSMRISESTLWKALAAMPGRLRQG